MFHKKAPNVRFREGFGMTEASPVITFTRGELVDTKGASGQLMPNMKMKVTTIIIAARLVVDRDEPRNL